MYMELCLFTAKNVAADIAEKLCDSVAAKLEGKVLGTFGSMCVFCHYLFSIHYSFKIVFSIFR